MADSKPIIFSIDDDVQVLRAISRDLKKKYRSEYRILNTASAQDALHTVEELRKKGEEIALFVSDQRMPEMEGVDFLERARNFYPNSKRVLLTAYSDTDAAIKAINDVQLDFYLMKPWNPPEERLYPTLDDLLDDWQAGFKPKFKGIKVLGYQYSPDSHALKDFLAGNLIPYQWIDARDSREGTELMELHKLQTTDLPAVINENGDIHKAPRVDELAGELGLNPSASHDLYDVAIIGAGPAGLAAGVYGGSEGLRTLLIEKRAPGGQAGTSSRIENYLGFPKGLSGSDLSRRAITQATRFGVEFLSPKSVEKIQLKHGYKLLTLNDGNTIKTRAVVITTGVDYRKLDKEGLHDFTGAGVYYGAATTEAAACKNQNVFVIGGGNSAGQAAMYLSQFAKKVYILIRKPDLSSSMSSYLIDQINSVENIEVKGNTEIEEAKGTDRLEEVTLVNNNSGEKETYEAGALFIFIGARPYTDWIDKSVLRDEKGFLLTGRDLLQQKDSAKQWKLDRDPFLLETSISGIFAAGDVRSGAMNRVASAVGEGAMAISLVHKYLEEN